MRELGTVRTLRRYPVKSMLGEELAEAVVNLGGVDKDRTFALIDTATGRVASAKQPRLWRVLLQCRAAWNGGQLEVTLPGKRAITITEGGMDEALSELIGRQVRLSDSRADGALIARPSAEDVIDHGVDADLPYELLQIAEATCGRTFVDYAPLSLITTSTLALLGTESVRYRPNVVVETSPAVPPFAENDWVGREIQLGPVRVRGLMPTPRCAIPTLEHGDLPRALQAVRTLLTANRIRVPGFGVVPCAGLYTEVVAVGTIHPGDTAVLR